MKKVLLIATSACALLVTTTFYACNKNSSTPVTKTPSVTAATLQKITDLGFSTDQVVKTDGGYLVEGDILLTDANLNEAETSPILRIAETEQYRTTNLVKSLPRTVTVSISNLPQVYIDATTAAVARYNALKLTLKFQIVSSGGGIQIIGFNEAASGGYITLGSSGFPTTAGDPYNQIKLNTNVNAYGSNPNLGYVTSVIQHEMGHCIGFRHTDYMNRAYSCGGSKSNEGKSTIGAVLIPGTPSKADPNSWMLACSTGSDRTFNANDITALNYLY